MKKRVLTLFLIATILTIFSFSSPILRADVSTGLTINYTNVPPVLLNPIPNQTWAKNTNLTNVFDLDDYFTDSETLTYSYSNSSLTNISITINETTNIVSFYPDYGFEGIETVTFIAYDSFTNTSSNNVTLNVTQDTSPPMWSNPTKNTEDSQIFQNTVVTFSTTWQDNIALSSNIFSIKQESGWVNQSPSSFSGTQNTSSYSIQISAPAGTLVEWKFYAFDTSGNVNSTDVQSFTVSSGTSSGTDEEDEDDYVSTGSGKKAQKAVEVITDFTVEEPEDGFFKIDIKQGTSGAVTVKITNIGNTDLSFDIDVDDLEEFEQLISEEKFNLTSGESKAITIEFTADRRLTPDLYYGLITVKSDSAGIWEIPIIIEVKAFEIDFDLLVKIPEEYKNIRPGEKVKANITIINLKEIEERDVTFYYALMDFKGNVIDSASEEFKFAQSSIMIEKELSLPPEIKMGYYIFFARAISGGAIAIGSDMFKVGEEITVAGFLRTNLLILLLILIAIILALLMMRHHKNKERLRLLNLYMMITELNKLIKEGKHEEAINIYIKIKAAYGEPVSETELKNKEAIKEEMETFSKKLDVKVLQKLKKKAQEQQKKENKNSEKESDEKSSKEDSEKEETEKSEEKVEKESSKDESKKLEKEIGEKLEEAKSSEKVEEETETSEKEKVEKSDSDEKIEEKNSEKEEVTKKEEESDEKSSKEDSEKEETEKSEEKKEMEKKSEPKEQIEDTQKQ